jgi:hypothetical protein
LIVQFRHGAELAKNKVTTKAACRKICARSVLGVNHDQTPMFATSGLVILPPMPERPVGRAKPFLTMRFYYYGLMASSTGIFGRRSAEALQSLCDEPVVET